MRVHRNTHTIKDWFKKMDSFREEYEDLLVQVFDGEMGLPQAFAKWTELGPKRFHQFLGERLAFKAFVRRFYDQLREMYNIDSCGVQEQFEMMRAKRWDLQRYAAHLKSVRQGK